MSNDCTQSWGPRDQIATGYYSRWCCSHGYCSVAVVSLFCCFHSCSSCGCCSRGSCSLAPDPVAATPIADAPVAAAPMVATSQELLCDCCFRGGSVVATPYEATPADDHRRPLPWLPLLWLLLLPCLLLPPVVAATPWKMLLCCDNLFPWLLILWWPLLSRPLS
jgi:hypothetical protein